MVYIESPFLNPYFNLALEQYIFDDMDKNEEYFMLWQNENTIVVGKHQNTIQEINKKFVEENKINVVRRLSGGGAVYHDLGNLNFTFIVDGNDVSEINFDCFCMPIVKALKKLNVNAEINGRNDITIEGKKFSGNSQYIKKGRIMHHGTIMYNSNLDIVTNALNVSKDKIESKGIKSVKSRVTNVKNYINEDISIEQFKNLLLKYIFEDKKMKKYNLTENDIKKIKEYQNNIYEKWDWNYGASPKYNIVKERRIDGCGKISVYIYVENGLIQDINFYGDYFNSEDIDELKKYFIGINMEKTQIKNIVNNINIERFFKNMNKNDFINILTD